MGYLKICTSTQSKKKRSGDVLGSEGATQSHFRYIFFCANIGFNLFVQSDVLKTEDAALPHARYFLYSKMKGRSFHYTVCLHSKTKESTGVLVSGATPLPHTR